KLLQFRFHDKLLSFGSDRLKKHASPMAWTSNQSLSFDALQLAVATAFDPHRRQTYGSVLCRQVEIQIASVCHRRIKYFPPKLKSSINVTLSALVQTPTAPASLNVSSLASMTTLPSKLTLNWLPAKSTRNVCH